MCDTDVDLCDICSLNEAEFDDQSMQCVIKEDSGLNRNIYIGEISKLKIGINFLFLVSIHRNNDSGQFLHTGDCVETQKKEIWSIHRQSIVSDITIPCFYVLSVTPLYQGKSPVFHPPRHQGRRHAKWISWKYFQLV